MYKAGPGHNSGRRILITGGASKTGLAVGQLFAHQGAKVAILDVDDKAVVSAIEAIGPHTPGFVADVRDRSLVKQAVADLQQRWGGLDVLICAATARAQGKLAALDAAVWDDVLSVNIKGTLTTCQEALPTLRASMDLRYGGRIVLLGSLSAASEAALGEITRVLAGELAGTGITVNSVRPAGETKALSSGASRQMLGDNGFRFRRPTEVRDVSGEDVVQRIRFLCSRQAKSITGSVYAA